MILELSTWKSYADRMLEAASYPESGSPLLADRIDRASGTPWREEDGHIVSNAAHQQNFLRFLCGLSALSGDPRYEERARAVMQYMMDHPMAGGLLRWGGHRYLDLVTLKDRGEKELVHELKNDYPYYELMFRADPDKAELYVKSFWNAHVYDFEHFEMGRHSMEKPYGVEGIWERPFADPEPFAPRKGLSFRNTGNDLMYAAGKLREARGDEGALLWAGRMHDMYMKCRHPETKLGPYQFSQAMKRMDTQDDRITLSFYGDRAKRQLGPEFGPVALEANVLLKSQEISIYALNPQIIAAVFDHDTPKERQMIAQTAEGMKAFYEYGYDRKNRGFRPLLADGTDLSGYELPRPGYYGPKGRILTQHPLAGDYFLAYVEMALITGDQDLWKIVGVWEEDLDIRTPGTDPGVLLALLRLAEKDEAYRAPAMAWGERMEKAVEEAWKHGDSLWIDAIEPLVLLKLEALRQNAPRAVADPIYNRSSSREGWSENRTIK